MTLKLIDHVCGITIRTGNRGSLDGVESPQKTHRCSHATVRRVPSVKVVLAPTYGVLSSAVRLPRIAGAVFMSPARVKSGTKYQSIDVSSEPASLVECTHVSNAAW